MLTKQEKCGIEHALGGQQCNRAKGHDGYCCCKTVRGEGGNITYSVWVSEDGKFKSHVGYRTVYPANATPDEFYDWNQAYL
jgi:hypothetical protein